MNADAPCCHKCGGRCDLWIAQAAHGGRLTWSASLQCDACGPGLEMDGAGLPPPDFRSRLLVEGGVHELVLEDRDRIVPALRVVRKVLGVPMQILALFRQRIPGAIVFGTKCEMEWLASGFGLRGVAVSVKPKDPSLGSTSLDLVELIPPDGVLRAPIDNS